MTDQAPEQRYVGYPRPGDPTPKSDVAELVVLLRCHRAWLIFMIAAVALLLAYVFTDVYSSPVFRAAVATCLVCSGVALYVWYIKIKPASNLERALGAIPLAASVLLAIAITLIPARHFAVLPSLLNLLIMPINSFLSKQLKKTGFKSWKEIKAEIERVQELERQNYVPPVPEGIFSGEPPRLP